MKYRAILIFLGLTGIATVQAQINPNAFQPLIWELPTPDACRLASGAPGPQYWQQQVDYQMELSLDDVQQRLNGREVVTYHNNSPHTLTYLWLQLDQEYHRPGSMHDWVQPAANNPQEVEFQREGGCEVKSLRIPGGADLKYTIVETNLRIELPQPLQPGQEFRFELAWAHNITDATIEGRSGYERMEDGNYIYEMAQFFPRLCLYDGVKGWQNMPFLGPAEFALEFGNYDVSITAPADHVVAATGTLQNEAEVLTAAQQERLKQIRATHDKVAYVVTPEEAAAAEKGKAAGTRTWKFHADNVRDFAFASSRKFVWDAAQVQVGSKDVLAMSFYPRAAMPLWNTYSTHAVMHTLKVYSRFTVDYPYPTAQSVNGAVWGMEYPMICFCGGRPERNGTYSKQTKYSMISVVIHEVGHNFFPMIINNDERRWAWMDEGFNSFLQFWAEEEWEPGYPRRRGGPAQYGIYMNTGTLNPIMTNPESIVQNGRTSYEKTTVGLVMMRNTLMGRENFDYAFREYARRWALRHPEPADFFRTMEDAGGVNLDWFFRAWFMGTASADIAMDVLSTREEEGLKGLSVGEAPGTRNPAPALFYTDDKPELLDAYSKERAAAPEAEMDRLLRELEKQPRDLKGVDLEKKDQKVKIKENTTYVTLLEFKNLGSMPLPLILQVTYTDGTREDFRMPAWVWGKNAPVFRKELRTRKPIKAIVMDPYGEVPELDRTNNVLPRI